MTESYAVHQSCSALTGQTVPSMMDAWINTLDSNSSTVIHRDESPLLYQIIIISHSHIHRGRTLNVAPTAVIRVSATAECKFITSLRKPWGPALHIRSHLEASWTSGWHISQRSSCSNSSNGRTVAYSSAECQQLITLLLKIVLTNYWYADDFTLSVQPVDLWLQRFVYVKWRIRICSEQTFCRWWSYCKFSDNVYVNVLLLCPVCAALFLPGSGWDPTQRACADRSTGNSCASLHLQPY